MKTAFCAGLALTLLAPAAPCIGGDEAVVVRTTLTDLRSAPDAFRAVRVSFVVQFVGIGDLSNPFFTQFVPSQFANFHVWADEQPIWRRESYKDVFGQLFLAKNNAQLEQLYSLRLYQRLRVEGIVRDVFQGTPWIEVTGFERVAGQVNTPGLAHLYRGEQLMEKRQWQSAIAELSMADASGVPETVAAAVARNMAICHLRIGEAGTAIGYLNRASSLLGDRVDRETERLLATANATPQKELDRSVRVQNVKDHERPLWEAFEDAQVPPTGLPSKPQ